MGEETRLQRDAWGSLPHRSKTAFRINLKAGGRGSFDYINKYVLTPEKRLLGGINSSPKNSTLN